MPDLHGLSFDDLRIVQAVARSGSLTRAGTATGYSQSAISRRVAGVEASIGTPLFQRSSRGVSLTAAGKTFVAHAARILADLDEVQRTLSGDAPVAATIRLGTFTTANAWLVPRAARHLLSTIDLHLTVEEDLSPGLIRRVRRDSLDLALVSDYPTGRLDVDGLSTIPLLSDPLLVAMAVDHPLADQAQLRLADLRHDNWIDGSTSSDTMLSRAAQRVGFQPTIRHQVREWTAKLGFVAAGLGVTIVPKLLAEARDDVVVRAVGDDLPHRAVLLVSAQDVATRAATAALRDALLTVVDPEGASSLLAGRRYNPARG